VRGNKYFFSVALICLCYTFALSAQAERYRYVDSSGNIHFVNSLKQVPREYMHQIMTPTPRPVYSKREMRRIEAEKRRRQREKEAAERRKERAREQMRRRREMELQKQRKRMRRQEEEFGFSTRQ
jgi:type IV secretory pathway VirB10-like protein